MKSKFLFYTVIVHITFYVLHFTSFAQDIHFSQFDETPLQLNPANAALYHDIRVITNYKSQWQSVGLPYRTFAFSGEVKLLHEKKNNLGLGIDFFNDKAGDAQMKTSQANISLSGIIPLNEKSVLSGGLMFGFAQRSLSDANLTWENQYNGMAYDASLPSGETNSISNYSYPDLGVGIKYSYGTDELYISANNSRKINIGASIFHPHQPVYSFYGDKSQNLHMKVVLHGDAAFSIKNTNLILKPSYIVLIQGAAKEITPGITYQYIIQEGSKYTLNKMPTAFSVGSYYRAKDAIILVAKFEYANYAIGFSYDVNHSKLRTVTSARGGYEISLRYISPGAFSRSKHKSRI